MVNKITEKIKTLLPDGWTKTDVFLILNESSFNITFFTTINNKLYYCYNLEEYGINAEYVENELKAVHKEMLGSGQIKEHCEGNFSFTADEVSQFIPANQEAGFSEWMFEHIAKVSEG